MLHITVSIATVAQILHRAGFSPQQPIQRAAERDETAIEHWRRHQWPAVKESRAGRGDAPRAGRVDLFYRRVRTVAESSQGPHLGRVLEVGG
jgi:hypothetical protein